MPKPARPYIPEPPAPHEPGPSYGPCVFRCNSSWRKATETHDKALATWIADDCHGPEPAPVEIEPWPGDPVYCRRCSSIIRGALRELPLAYTALGSVKFLTRTASADEERRGRSDVPPSPSPGADHADEILHTTTAWEDDLRRHLGHTAATDRFGDPHATLTAAVEYLNTHWTAMIGREECAADFGDETWRLHAIALAMVKNKPVRRFLPVPCPSCDTRALIQEEGLAKRPWYVECAERLGGCSRLYSELEYEWLCRLVTGGHVSTAVAA
jgi:hypothetical protein